MNISKNSYKKCFKPLEEMNLIDSFVFRASTENNQDAKFIAKLIIERATGVKLDQIDISPEKSLAGFQLSSRGIRMDLYVETFQNGHLARVYDIEPNNYNPKELPMRSRFCQSITDVKLLGAGEGFRKLAEYISIWILPFDPFGKNRMLYTVKNSVENFPNIVYNDGVKKLFLYTGGTLGGNEELKKLLTYFSDSKSENATDSDLKQLHNIVESIKHNQKVGVRYMTLQDYIEMERDAYFRDIEEQIRADMKEQLVPEVREDLKEQLVPEVREDLKEQLVPEVREQLKKELASETRNMLQDENIIKLIYCLRDFSITDEQILNKLEHSFLLTKEEAVAYLKKAN